MVNTKILLSVVIVLLIGIAAASIQINSDSPSLWTFTNPQDTVSEQSQSTPSGESQTGAQEGTSTVSQQSGDGGINVKISITKAKSIAQDSIEQPGAEAGTPELKTVQGEKVYYVPIMYNGENAGYFLIDAQTGEVIEGAGGAP